MPTPVPTIDPPTRARAERGVDDARSTPLQAAELKAPVDGAASRRTEHQPVVGDCFYSTTPTRTPAAGWATGTAGSARPRPACSRSRSSTCSRTSRCYCSSWSQSSATISSSAAGRAGRRTGTYTCTGTACAATSGTGDSTPARRGKASARERHEGLDGRGRENDLLASTGSTSPTRARRDVHRPDGPRRRRPCRRPPTTRRRRRRRLCTRRRRRPRRGIPRLRRR